MDRKPVTLREFLDDMAASFAASNAYMWLENDRIISKSFIELRDDAARMAWRIRRQYGTQRKIALIGNTSYSWICAYYGIMTSANISVPLDAKLSVEELIERLKFADVSVVYLSRQQAGLQSVILSRCEQVKAVLLLEDCLSECADAPSDGTADVDPDALSSLMFTSGTSGDGLKAAMITQRAILADVTGLVPLCEPGDRLLSLLPIHHCFEIFVGQMKYLYLGGTICINDSMANLIPNLTRFGISIVVAVPALANMLAAFIVQNLKSHTPQEVRSMLGGRLRRITIGGASASREVIDILGRAGITIFVGYGLTESTGGCLANCDASIRPREAGAPYVEGMQMRLDDGELCLRGPMLMQGYYKSPELTSSILKDGWLHTGDLAEITDEGYVIIHGRKDNMIKTPNGEKIYPENWENHLTSLPYVSAAMVAQIDHHLAALIHLRQDEPSHRAAVMKAVDEINTGLPGYEKILDVRFREEPFPMTTSMKIRRGAVMKALSEEHTAVSAATPPENQHQRMLLRQAASVLASNAPIGIDDNLYERGLDSLSTIGLSILLNCDAETIYACKTIRRLSLRLLEDSCAGVIEKAAKIDGINRFIRMAPPVRRNAFRTVLLTGASGYLGAHLMHALLDNGYHVICLVRNETTLDRALRHYGFEADRARADVVVGDITIERLGITPDAYGSLCAQVDAVFHAAALVSHVGSAEASFKVNVEGTRTVIDFCKAAGAGLFHISSCAVAGFKTEQSLTEEVLDIGQEIGWNPYVQTKYQAEERVLLARAEGVPSTIFRVGNLSARASDGIFQINPEANGQAAQLRAIRRMGVYPESMGSVPYDRTPVDRAAQAIALLAGRSGTGRIWHIIDPDIRYLEQLTGAEMIADGDFSARLAADRNDRDAAILAVYYRMKQNGFNTRFDASRTQSELARLGFDWKQ